MPLTVIAIITDADLAGWRTSHGAHAFTTTLFADILHSTLLLISGLSYLPALTMGPLIEHIQLWH